MRVMIGLQLVIAGFQLPAKYQLARWKEMALCRKFSSRRAFETGWEAKGV